MPSALDLAADFPPPPPPPQTLDSGRLPSSPATSSSYSPSVVIIIVIIAAVIAVSAAIHLILGYLSRRRRRSSPSIAADDDEDQDRSEVSISISGAPKSSADCAVCLSAFRATDELRRLPLCRHAFHARCIDAWISSTPSCPLCRSPISPPPPSENIRRSTPASPRFEIGSVSRHSSEPSDPGSGPDPRISSFEYSAEEEVEAVLARIRRRPEKDPNPSGDPAAPGDDVAAAIGSGGGRGRLNRLASSASSSFNSIRLSWRWSCRFDGGGAAVSGDGGRESWDSELEESGLSGIYRWITGA